MTSHVYPARTDILLINPPQPVVKCVLNPYLPLYVQGGGGGHLGFA